MPKGEKSKPIEMSGRRFGRLLVLNPTAARAKDGSVNWACHCDCGNECVVCGVLLRNGDTTSCGCYIREITSKRSRTHGKSSTIEYRAWQSAISRCENVNSDSFGNYGARGISMCARWRVGEDGLSGFECFLADVGPRPPKMNSLDRIKNERGYEPGNVRWATILTQNRNKRSNVIYKGCEMTLKQAVRRAGGIVKYATAFARVRRGWDVKSAVEIDMRRGVGA